MSEPRSFLGYRLEWAPSGGVQEGAHFDSAGATLHIVEEATNTVVHTLSRSARGSHHLRKQYRAPTINTESMIGEAEGWILANRPDAHGRREAERATVADQNRAWRRDQLERHGGDWVAYAVATAPSMFATEVGEALRLGSARRLNAWLLEWGLLTRTRDGYALVDEMLGEIGEEYGTVRWDGEGLKAIWDAAVAHGVAHGGDAEFVARLRANTTWLAVE